METGQIIILILYVLMMVFCINMLYRNNRTHAMLIKLNQMVYNKAIRQIDSGDTTREPREIINRLSYKRILLSMKPIKMEYWVTSEELNFLNN